MSPISIARSSRTPVASPQRQMNMDTYFRLLKKSQVLDHLLGMNQSLHHREKQVRQLESAKAKSDSVQLYAFTELEAYQTKYVDLQKLFLELLETMTALCVKDELLQLGKTSAEATTIARETAEERTMKDLQKASTTFDDSSSRRLATATFSIESHALNAVGTQRARQLERIFTGYEKQLMNGELALTDAVNLDRTKYLEANVASLESKITHQEREKVQAKVQSGSLASKLIHCVCWLIGLHVRTD